MTAMLRAGALRGYWELVRELGGRPESLLRKHHIPQRSQSDEDTLMSLRSYVHLLEDSSRQLRCPDFGLRMAAVQDIDFLGPLAIGIQNAETLSDAMLFISRFLFVHSPGIALTVFERSPVMTH